MAQVEGGPVNIWFWKNKDNKGVDMNAKGFGTLNVQTHQDVKAKGVYANTRDFSLRAQDSGFTGCEVKPFS
jgi:hypothetical protein